MSSLNGQQRLFPASIEAWVIASIGKLGGMATLGLVAAIWASLISWSASDPSLTHATGERVANWLGAPGAVISDLMIETLGFASLAALLTLTLWGLELLTSERIVRFRTRAGWMMLALVAIAGALSSLPKAPTWPLVHGNGGILGDMIINAVVSLLAIVNPRAAGLLAGGTLFVVGATALMRASGLTRRDMQAMFTVPKALRRPHLVRAGAARLGAGSASLAHRLQEVWSARTSLFDVTQEPVERDLPSLDAPSAAAGFGFEAPLDRASAPRDEIALEDETGDEDDCFEFDDTIDASSRAMAARFAPSTGRRPLDASVVATPAVAEPLRAPVETRRPFAAEPHRPFAAEPHRQIAVEQPKAKAETASMPVVRRDTGFKLPPLATLKRGVAGKQGGELTQTMLRGSARLLEDVLADFGVKGEVRDIRPGPVVTLFEFEPARGVKSARVIALADDIARSLGARAVRVAVVPGRNAIGIELPNAKREAVALRDILETEPFRTAGGPLPIALGRSIGGEPVVADLALMPHLLVAGTTGSGKSVGINAMIVSLLMRLTPQECRLLMIDPKMLELSVYNGIPHLLAPVVTDAQKAVAALNWAVGEMEERYKKMAQAGVRHIEAFNARVKSARVRGETIARTVQTGFDPRSGQPVYEHETVDLAPMPYIVVVVDEFADLMIAAGKEIEVAVQRLAQKARAAGVHLVMATQRPSVDVITGTIKANFPTRISFKVASKIDSRTILNEQGAEQLLGHGDMLFAGGSGQTARVHGPLVTDEEVESVVEFLRAQGTPKYVDGIMGGGEAPAGEIAARAAAEDAGDGLYDRAVAVVLRDRKASTSYLQRRLSIGYNRAADIMERLERDGVVSAPDHVGRREILAAGSGADGAEGAPD